MRTEMRVEIVFAVFLLSAKIVLAASSSIPTTLFVSTNIARQVMSESSSRKTKTIAQPCRAAVVNHHVLAADVIARLVQTIRNCHDLKRAIILSPDHYQASIAPIVTHRHAYRVDDISMPVDEEGIDRLLKTVGVAREDDRSYWQAEHGVGAIVPFLAQVSTSTKILPVVVRATITLEQSKQLSRWLANEMKRGAFVLVSSDMSHYLPERQALANDRKTMAAFARRDAGFFAKSNDDYTDNGKSIAAMMSALGRTSWQIVGHSISTKYDGAPGYTTSYVTGVWK
mgnify:CR=1 FL=1